MKHILFTGGGSAGHVVPNLAIMHELRYTHTLSYMGTGGIEKQLVEGAGFPFFRVDSPKLIRSFSLENLKIPVRLRRAKRKTLETLKKLNPDLVFSKGGFVSYPAVWAAHKLGIPVLTHESDLSPGLCTRLIAKKCVNVLTSFPETARRFQNGKYVGSPIRREVENGERSRARRKFGLPEQGAVLLVFGGGSGSHALNQAVESALPLLLTRFSVLHLTGKADAPFAPPREERGTAPQGVYLRREYEADMGSAYACADLVLSRAGSNTVFEILALKKPAVLVPLARSSRGDQAENAAYFEQRGLVKVLPESELSSRLFETLTQALSDPLLAQNLRESTFPNGTENIVRAIKETLDGRLDQAGGAREYPSPKMSACK